MRHFSLHIVFAALGACLYTACLFPEIAYLGEDDNSTAGGGGATGTPTTGGTAGIGGMPVTTTAGGAGQGGMLECELNNLGVTGLCGPGQKCTVTNAAAGSVDCAMAGTTPDWAICTDDSDCTDGSWCDLVGNVCKPFCRNNAECDVEGSCLRAPQAGGTDIPNNVKTCISMCSPLDATPCGTNSVTCAFIGSNQFDCRQSNNFTRLQVCDVQADCAATLACISDIFGDKACEQFCSPIGSNHANCSITNCGSISNPEVEWMGMEIGTCF